MPLFSQESSNLLILSTVVGTLKGYDQLMNLVLDDVKENLRGIFFYLPRYVFVIILVFRDIELY